MRLRCLSNALRYATASPRTPDACLCARALAAAPPSPARAARAGLPRRRSRRGARPAPGRARARVALRSELAARSRAFAAAASRSARGRAALGLVSFDDPKPAWRLASARARRRRPAAPGRSRGATGETAACSPGVAPSGGSRLRRFRRQRSRGVEVPGLEIQSKRLVRAFGKRNQRQGFVERVRPDAPALSRGRSPKGAEEDGIASCALGRKSEAARSASSTTSSKSNAYPSSPPSMARAPRTGPRRGASGDSEAGEAVQDAFLQPRRENRLLANRHLDSHAPCDE